MAGNGSHPFIHVKCGNKLVEHPAFLLNEDNDRGVSTVKWVSTDAIEEVSSDLVVKELPSRRTRRKIENHAEISEKKPVGKSVSTKKSSRKKKKKKESVPSPEPALLKEAADEMIGILQHDHPDSPLPSPTCQQDPSSSDDDTPIYHKSKPRAQSHSASKRQSSIASSHALPILPPDLNVILPPTDYLSNENLESAKEDLAPYLNPNSKGIRNDKIESLIENIINQPSIKSQEHILFTLTKLKNSENPVQKALFDTKDPSKAACKIIFNTWLDHALTIMSNKRHGHENKCKMRSMKGIQTEEKIAIEIMKCIKSFDFIHEMKQLNIMKEVFEVDWFQCIIKTQAFAQEHCIRSLLKFSSEANCHLDKILLNNIKLKTSPPNPQLHHADFAAGNAPTMAKYPKPKKPKLSESSTAKSTTKSDQPSLIMQQDVSENMALEQLRNNAITLVRRRSSRVAAGKARPMDSVEMWKKTKQVDELDQRRRSISMKDKKRIEEQTRMQFDKMQEKRGESSERKEDEDEKSEDEESEDEMEDRDKERTGDESRVSQKEIEDNSMYV